MQGLQKWINRTHNWQCRYGCDRFLRNLSPRSVTIPHVTRKGYYWLDCKKCFGHGRITVDPNCKFGCGRWIKIP